MNLYIIYLGIISKKELNSLVVTVWELKWMFKQISSEICKHL